jgi:hypothetical protein
MAVFGKFRGSAGSGRRRVLDPVSAQTRLRRSPVMVVVGVAVVVAGALGGFALWRASSSAVEVLAVRAEVLRGDTLAEGDLVSVRVTVDPAQQVVPADQLGGVVGKRVLHDLMPGTLLAFSQVGDELPPPSGYRVVAVTVGSGQWPSEEVLPGDEVTLADAEGHEEDVEVSRVAEADGGAKLDVLVAEGHAVDFQVWASKGSVTVSLLPRSPR